MRILLIDDDADDQAIFCEAVSEISPAIRCEIAGNGEEGLNFLGNCSSLPDLVFLDINMPVMGGMETILAMRSAPRLKDLKVIMYSTSNFDEEVKQYVRLGARFMTKPTSFNELVTLLRAAIREAGVLTERRQII